MKTLNTHPSTAKRRGPSCAGILLTVTAAIAVGAMTALAPAANAQSERQIQGGCTQANGTYNTGVTPDGTRYSFCCYKDYYGDRWCDAYENGRYLGTQPNNIPPPVSGPPGPPAKNPPVAPPITNPPPAANAN